eukprot:11538577-Karenia_brevis.AAC.1
MVAEHGKGSEAKVQRSDEELAKIVGLVVQKLLPQLQQAQSSGSRKKQSEDSKKVALDEKHIRSMDKFTGDVSQSRMWMFNLGVTLGQ